MEHIRFPSINQFRNVVANVRRKAIFEGLDANGEPILNHAKKAPSLAFIGTVKLHGTNAAIVFTKDSVHFQSRERVLTTTEDNAGFYNYMVGQRLALDALYSFTAKHVGLDLAQDHTIAVYGEWCGDNIQKGVAITGLAKMFVIFAIKVNGQWASIPEEISSRSGFNNAGIYSIEQFPKWFYTIDFENPERAQNFLGELTLQVEAECPVGKAFGVSGIGEGIVWRCIDDPSSDLWFKVKGEKHSVSKVKTLAPADVEAAESMQAFIDKTVTEARLEQGLHNLVNEQLKPLDMTSIGDFIRWVHTDIVKEESDTMQASGIDPKKVGGHVAKAAKRWYVEHLNSVALAA